MDVMLFSGGLDSLCLWHLAGKPRPVYVRTGIKYQDREADTVWELGDRVPGFQPHFVDGPDLGRLELPDGHVPHRNLLLAATAAANFPAADRIVLGALLGEASPDKSARFLRAASRALTASEHRTIRVDAPARHWTKTGLLRRFLAAHPDAAPLIRLTRSCYSADDSPCGNCQACFRRHVALWHNWLADTPPSLPTGTGPHTALSAALTAGPARWPALAVNNAQAAAAVAGLRWPGRAGH